MPGVSATVASRLVWINHHTQENISQAWGLAVQGLDMIIGWLSCNSSSAISPLEWSSNNMAEPGDIFFGSHSPAAVAVTVM
jgi:hypothetical protein